MTTPGLRVDQVAPAFVSVPGVTISLINNFPSGTKTYNGSSYADIDTTNLKGIAFVAPVAGSYLITLRHSIYSTSTGADGRLKLIFDAGTGSEQSVFDNTLASLFFNAGTSTLRYDHSHTIGPLTLSAGAHTIGLQWKFVAGVGSLQTDAPSAFVVTAQLVTGSGAGGVIVTKNPSTGGSAQVISSVAPSFTDITAMTATVTTVANEQVMVSYGITTNSSTSCTTELAIHIDGTLYTRSYQFQPATTTSGYMTETWISPALSAGAHVVKLSAAKGSGGEGNITAYGPGASVDVPCYLHVTQFRGGLVPIQKDGVSIIDTPAAFNFTGPGCEVTNVDGTATIDITGANYIGFFNVDPAGTYTVTDATYTAFDASFSQTFTVPKTGTYLCNLVALGYSSGASYPAGFLRLNFDSGAQYIPSGDTFGWQVQQATFFRLAYTFLVTLTAGEHTCQPEAKETTGSTHGIQITTTLPWQGYGILVA